MFKETVKHGIGLYLNIYIALFRFAALESWQDFLEEFFLGNL